MMRILQVVIRNFVTTRKGILIVVWQFIFERSSIMYKLFHFILFKKRMTMPMLYFDIIRLYLYYKTDSTNLSLTQIIEN